MVIPEFMDHGKRAAAPDFPLTAAQWGQLEANFAGVFLDNHTAARLGLKDGDSMPVLAQSRN